jgi:hypothetical protein
MSGEPGRTPMDRMERVDRAEIIRKVMEINECVHALLDLVLPEGLPTECPHPSDKIVDDSTMDDAGQLYRCTACGATSPTPFPTFSKD